MASIHPCALSTREPGSGVTAEIFGKRPEALRGDVAVFLLILLLGVTGIPYTEKRALASRGDDYRAYQRATSPFIPWFPKAEKP